MEEVRSHGLRPVQSEGLENPLAEVGPAPMSEDVNQAIRAWDNSIKKMARSAAWRAGGSVDDAEDFAQAARLALVRSVRRGLPEVEAYQRRLVRNAVSGAARRERGAFGALSTSRTEFEDALTPIDERRAAVRAQVADWVATLPPSLQHTFELLYVQGRTQREAADLLNVTQPRICQLHTELKRRGREELLAA